MILQRKLDRAEIERAVVEQLMKFDGVSLAISSSALAAGGLPDTPLINAILKNFNPKRSGDIYLVFDPQRFINDFDGLVVASTHGSPWRYDSYVPIMVAGPGIAAQKIDRKVHTVDLALTLSLLLGVNPPSGAQGAPLHEVLQGGQ